MKRWIATLAGALILAAAAAGSPALAQSHDHHGGGGHGGGGRGGESHGGGRGGPGGGYGGGYRAPQGGHYGGAPYGGGGPYNSGPRYGPQGGPPPGWNDQRQNGYWIGNRWHYGPPTTPDFAPGYRPGYAPWRRGAVLPPYYQNSVVEDYWDFRLRRPPSGYHWVRAGNSFLLVAAATGLIFDVVQ